MKSIVFFTGFFFLLILIVSVIAPPPPRNTGTKTEKETKNKSVEKDEDDDDLPKYEFHYSKYLEKVVQILENDPRFNEKIKELNEEDIRSGKLADHFDIISNDVAMELTKVKLQEIERLREAIQKQIEEDKGAHNVRVPEHIDINELDKFHAEDLRKLVKKTYEDMDEINRQRKEKFKQHEMVKQAKYEHELAQLPEEMRKKMQMEHEEALRRRKEHEKINLPGERQQLEEVWSERDHMAKEDFDPKTFFSLHDLDSDGFWNIQEMDALFQLELNKLYNESNPNYDPKEKDEEMYRMRDYMLSKIDKNKDRMISLQEFLEENNKQVDKPASGSWEDIADNKVYTDEELQKFEEEYAKEHGWGPDAYKIEPTIVPPTTTPVTVVHAQQQQYNQENHHKVDPVMGI